MFWNYVLMFPWICVLEGRGIRNDPERTRMPCQAVPFCLIARRVSTVTKDHVISSGTITNRFTPQWTWS